MYGIYYSFQTLEAYESLKNNGYLKCPANHASGDFKVAYNWLVGQMDKRLGVVIDEGYYPIWVWSTYRNLNDKGNFAPNQEGVRLTLAIPNKLVLLSDFDAWHAVLNNHELMYTEDEWEKFECGQSMLTKEKSWERIFNLEEVRQSEIWGSPSQWVQGVTPYITLNQVLRVDKFKSK